MLPLPQSSLFGEYPLCTGSKNDRLRWPNIHLIIQTHTPKTLELCGGLGSIDTTECACSAGGLDVTLVRTFFGLRSTRSTSSTPAVQGQKHKTRRNMRQQLGLGGGS